MNKMKIIMMIMIITMKIITKLCHETCKIYAVTVTIKENVKIIEIKHKKKPGKMC